MTNLLSLLFDAGLAVLLIVTIGYCSKLSRRIRLLQDSRSELAGMITQFDQATGRAMASLAELQTVSKRITEGLQLKIEKANFLADDLAFLIEKGAKVATQLEQLRAAAAPKSPSEPDSPPLSQHPIPAFKPKIASYQPSAAKAADIPTSIQSAASLEALLTRLGAMPGNVSSSATKTAAPKPQPKQAPRTDAERELLEALKPGR